MSTQWTVTALLGVLVFLNSLATIGLIRQVGLLHLRVRPVPPLATSEAPERGGYLGFAQDPWDLVAGDGAERLLLAFVAPSCSLCDSLIRGIDSLAAEISPRIRTIFASEAALERAREYIGSRGSSLPILAEDGAMSKNSVPGTPYGVVIDRSHRVLAAGGLNTLEHVELLIDRSEEDGLAGNEAVEHDHDLSDSMDGRGAVQAKI